MGGISSLGGKPSVVDRRYPGMSPLEVIARQLDRQAVGQLSQRVGASPQQTQTAAAGIAEALLGAMARQAQGDPRRVQKIERALERDNHSALLDNLGAILGGGSAPTAVSGRAMNGMGILRHILGNRTGRVADQVGNASGLNTAQVGQLMVVLAPIVMGALAKSRRQAPQQQDLAGILGQVLGGGGGEAQTQPSVNRSFLDAVLDRDGDGNSTDDLVRMGGQLLGGLTGRRRG